MTRLFLTTFLLQLAGLFPALHAQDFRYTEPVTTFSGVTTGVVYGTAPFLNFPYSDENFTSEEDLVMDVYQPGGDTHDRRPAIIFAHSGGFIVGDRTHDDMVALCDSFARLGYVTATIDYRQGFYLFNNVALHGTRAVYRGLQDGRAAVRFLRANAAAYGIDPDQVYLAGSSAGSFIALQSIYLSTADEIPPETGVQTYTDVFLERTTPDLGPPDVGENLGFSGTPNGVVALWGAVGNPDWVDAEDDEPVFLAHGTADETVAFESGPPFGAASFPDAFGSSVIADSLAMNGTTDYETYFQPEGPHEFYGTSNGSWADGSGPNASWDTLLNRVVPFLWRQHKPTAGFSFSEEGLTVDFSENAAGATAWRWDFGDGGTATGASPVHTYTEGGTYAVRLYVTNELLSYDTLTQLVTVVDQTLPLAWLGAPAAVWEGKDVRVSWRVADLEGVIRFVVEAKTGNGPFRSVGEVGLADQDPTLPFSFLHLAPSGYAQGSPATPPDYYRIRAEDYDGTVHYSPVGRLETEQASAWPNPTSGRLNLPVSFMTGPLRLLRADGREYPLLWISDHQLDLRGLPAGVYLLHSATSSMRILKTEG